MSVLKLPSEKILEQRLLSLEGLEHFLEKSKILKKLANQNKVAVGVVMMLDLEIYDYLEIFNSNPKNKNIIGFTLNLQRKDIVCEILKDYPKEFEKLEPLGLFDV